MNEVRGAVILCDHLDQMQNGKWLIVGTYTRRIANGDTVDFPTGAKLYIRFQVERTGTHAVELLFIDREKPSNAEPILRIAVNVEVHSIDTPAEFSIVTQPFTIARPADRPHGIPVVSTFTWLAKVGEHELASCPLIIQFMADGAPA